MRTCVAAALAICLVCVWAGPVAAQTAEVIADIRVHGNQVATNEEVLTIALVQVGMPFTATTIREVEQRLRASGKFEHIDVLKRFASITDMSQISLVLIVNEGAVTVEFEEIAGEDVARAVRREWWSQFMYLPILDGEDGYGLTYGVTTSLADVAGARSRLSMPLSWGGTKRAALILEKNFGGGPLTRVQVGTGIQRRENPAFEIEDRRVKVWARAEKAIGALRLGATTGWDRVTFDGVEDDLFITGGDVAFDTRLDPGYPRNAVYLSSSIERVQFEQGHTLYRTRLDGRGYLGLVGQTVLAVRLTRDGANGAQPRYLQPLMGGWSNLRGFQAGQFYGDIVVTGSAEYFVPLTSPMNVGRLGVSAFVDSGVAYDHGLTFSDQTRYTGVGGSLWFTATGFKLSLSVAHGRGGDTRVNFGGGFTF